MARTTPSRPVDVEALFPEVVSYRREATRLHPRQVEPGVRDSSVGGPLLWPAHEAWPHCLDAYPKIGFDPLPLGPVPLVPVLQLYAADAPDLPFPGPRHARHHFDETWPVSIGSAPLTGAS
jgi:hypothetical protein